MNDIERRLRAAMKAAAEQWSAEHQPGSRSSGGHRSAERWPGSLIEGIRRRHRRHVRRVAAGSVAAAVAVLLATPPVMQAFRVGQTKTGQSAASRAPTPRSSAPATTPSPVAARGTTLRGCDSANWGQLSRNWRSGSMVAGPLWFVYDAPPGYVQLGDSHSRTGTVQAGGKPRVGVMVIEVSFGSTVVMKVDPASVSYFRFVPYFDQTGGYSLRDGVTGLTLASCPRGTPAGPNGLVTDYYLGFLLLPGDRALVNIWPTASARPIRVTFTCQVRGCGT